MSSREMCVKLLDAVPDYKLGYVAAFLHGMTVDEDADDAFCMRLYEDYQSNPDRGDFVSFEDALKESGVSPDDL